MVSGYPEEAVVAPTEPSVVEDQLAGAWTRLAAFLKRWAMRFVGFFRLRRDTKTETPISPDSGSIGSDRIENPEQPAARTAQAAKQMIRLRK